MPEVAAGNALVAVGSGLMTTFNLSTPPGQWIGYQIIAGVGKGSVLQQVCSVQFSDTLKH
jgi:hypothetical protein